MKNQTDSDSQLRQNCELTQSYVDWVETLFKNQNKDSQKSEIGKNQWNPELFGIFTMQEIDLSSVKLFWLKVQIRICPWKVEPIQILSWDKIESWDSAVDNQKIKTIGSEKSGMDTNRQRSNEFRIGKYT